MSGFQRSATPYALKDASGNLVWFGAAFVACEFEFRSLEATNAFAAGEAVRFSVAAGAVPTNSATAYSFVPRWNFLATDATYDGQIGGLRVSAATDVGYIGVTLSGVPAGGVGMLCGPGSIVACVCTATTIGLGDTVGGSATAGSIATLVAAGGTASVAGRALGTCINTNLAFATPSTDTPRTGSTTQAGIIVAPR